MLDKTKVILGFQHVLAMFGATVLVPFLTGMDASVALLTAGIGTFIFHLCTKKIVPIFLGSSFAYIGAISLILKSEGIGSVKGGIMIAGLVYVAVSFFVRLFGVEKLKSFFPPIVIGPVIMVIGLRLSPVALSMAGYTKNTFDIKSLIVALSVVATMVLVSLFGNGFFKIIPILISVVVGYIIAACAGMVDFSVISQAPWIGFTSSAIDSLIAIPKFTATGILAIAPIAIVVLIEHIGDITTNGVVTGNDWFKNPGIHRTLLGDGLATFVSGILGGPTKTTYSENTGVLALTKVYDPLILRIAAVFAVALSLIGKFGIILQTIPTPVMGGISIILFGMIAAIGVRTLATSNIDFAHSRNILIMSLILVLGISIDFISIWKTVSVSGLTISAIVGVLLNKILPVDK